jgi:hypothetical protein
MSNRITRLHDTPPKFTTDAYPDDRYEDDIDEDEEELERSLPTRKPKGSMAVSSYGNRLPDRSLRTHAGPTLEDKFGEFARKLGEKSSEVTQVSAARVGIRLWSVACFLTGAIGMHICDNGLGIPFNGENVSASKPADADPKAPAPTTTTTIKKQ